MILYENINLKNCGVHAVFTVFLTKMNVVVFSETCEFDQEEWGFYEDIWRITDSKFGFKQ